MAVVLLQCRHKIRLIHRLMCRYADKFCYGSHLTLSFQDDFPEWLQMAYTQFYKLTKMFSLIDYLFCPQSYENKHFDISWYKTVSQTLPTINVVVTMLKGTQIDKMTNMATVHRETYVSSVIKISTMPCCTNPSFVWVMLKNGRKLEDGGSRWRQGW